MDEFGKVAVGEVQRQFLIELKDKIKHKFNQIRNENEKLSEVSTRILRIYYKIRKLKR